MKTSVRAILFLALGLGGFSTSTIAGDCECANGSSQTESLAGGCRRVRNCRTSFSCTPITQSTTDANGVTTHLQLWGVWGDWRHVCQGGSANEVIGEEPAE